MIKSKLNIFFFLIFRLNINDINNNNDLLTMATTSKMWNSFYFLSIIILMIMLKQSHAASINATDDTAEDRAFKSFDVTDVGMALKFCFCFVFFFLSQIFKCFELIFHRFWSNIWCNKTFSRCTFTNYV